MENGLDSLIQLKQASLEIAIATAIPTITTTVPSTLAASLAPTTPLSITLPSAITTTSATGSTTTTAHPSDEASKLVKAMEEMSIQTTKINRLKEQIRSLEDEKKLAQIMHKNEVQKSNRLTERIKNLEKELTLKEPLAQAKEHLWDNIIDSINDIGHLYKLSLNKMIQSKRLVKQFKELRPNLEICQKKPQE